MLSHDLILDAAEAAITRSRGPVGPVFMQHKVRVGFATAMQLVGALQGIGVLGPSTEWKHEVLASRFDRRAVLAATHDAAVAGRFELDDKPCADCRAAAGLKESDAPPR